MIKDRALDFLLSRGFSVVYSAVMFLAFGAVALFLVEPGSSAQLIWVFGSGVHLGIMFMWLISPCITERWRTKMTAEIEDLMQESLKRALDEADKHALRMWSPTIVPPDDSIGPGHKLQ